MFFTPWDQNDQVLLRRHCLSGSFNRETVIRIGISKIFMNSMTNLRRELSYLNIKSLLRGKTYVSVWGAKINCVFISVQGKSKFKIFPFSCFVKYGESCLFSPYHLLLSHRGAWKDKTLYLINNRLLFLYWL